MRVLTGFVELIEEDLPSNLGFILREPDPPRIRRISQTHPAHLKSPEPLFSSQILIQVLFGNQFKGHEILGIDGLALD
jgi:hypothetical protein